LETNPFETLRFSAPVFKDERSLFPEFLPPILPHTSKEISRLTTDFRPLIKKKGSLAINVVVTGAAGVGKTAVVRSYGKHLEMVAKKKGVNIKFTYYNARTFRTKTSILRNLLTDHFNVIARGISDEEISGMLVERLEKDDVRLIIALDDANLLGGNEILSIINACKDFDEEFNRISTIIICRHAEWRNLINASLSRHINDSINIPGYTKDELFDILSFRAQLAYYPYVISENVIGMIVDQTSKTQNTQLGIELLLKVGKITENILNSF
jgi:cell division control protein 6